MEWFKLLSIISLIIGVFGFLISIISVMLNYMRCQSGENYKCKYITQVQHGLDRKLIKPSMSIDVNYFAILHVLQMQPIDFDDCHQWKTISSATLDNQLFFSLKESFNHGVSIRNNNSFQLEKKGLWQYQFSWLISSNDNIILGASISDDVPGLANGYGTSPFVHKETRGFVVNGYGVLNVQSTNMLYQLWLCHIKQSKNYNIQVIEGNVSLMYIK